MGTSGAGSGRSWWAINAAILLVISFVLNSCTTPASASSSADPGDIVVEVIGAEGSPLVHGVVVRVTSSTQSDNEDNDGFKLESCTTGQFITAWAPGHQVGFSEECNGSKSYTVTLQSLEGIRDNPNYIWRSAYGDCKECHAGQFGGAYDELHEWEVTSHAAAFETSRYVESLDPEQAKGCLPCHAPTTNSTPFFSTDGNSAMEGVTCDVCHKVNGIILENNQYPSKPGIHSFQFVRSDLFKTGPFSNIIVPYPDMIRTAARSMCSNLFSKSEFCAACHYGSIENTLVYGSYKEWKESPYGSDPTSNEYRTCQDCHMSYEQANGGNQFTRRGACSETDPGFQNFSHNVMNFGLDSDLQRNIPRLIRGAAAIGATFEYRPQENNSLLVHVTVQNLFTGHNFPTDSPLRHLILVLDGKDQFSNVLTQLGGPKIPDLGGISTPGINFPGVNAYARLPGKIFANPLIQADPSLTPSVAYWRQFQSQPDAVTTLRSRGVDVSTYAFAAPIDGEVKFKISLLYRFNFYGLMQQPFWTDRRDRMDIPVAVWECLGNAAQIEYFRCTPIPQ